LSTERLDKRYAASVELLFQAPGAIAIATGPWLGAIFVFAATAIVRILNPR